jgi:hypothetical protein
MRRLALATTSGWGRSVLTAIGPASLCSAAKAGEYVFVFFMLNFLPALLRN